MNNRSYVIIDASEVASVDFDSVMEGADTLRYSVDGSKTFVKFAGETPSGLEGKTIYNYQEIRTLLATEEWSRTEPEV